MKKSAKVKIKKTLLLLLLVAITISFSGCLNLSRKEGSEKNLRNNNQGVFKTVDGGKTWQHKVKIDGSEELIDKVKIASMKMDPQNSNILYLGTVKNGLYKSENGADSWKKVTDENNILSKDATIYSIAIERGNSDIVYLAALNRNRGELLKSEDGGKSWTESYIIAEANKAVNDVKIDPLHKNIVYIGTEQGGFIKSENRGKSWIALHWFEKGVKDIIIDFHNSRGIIIRTTDEIFKSIDGGIKWESLNKKITDSTSTKIDFSKIKSMTMDNKNPLVVYITYLNLILKTKDGGYTWEKLNTITPSRTAVGTIPQVKQIGMIDNIIYYGAGNVLYKSENKGISWSSYNIPIKGDVRYTVSDYTNPDIIYVGAFYDPPSKKKKRNPFLPG
jgi:photosystem II stability/assembly factor-like uncharacterized protein